MKSSHYSSAPHRENPHGLDAKVLCSIPSAEAIMISLKPGQNIPPHATPVDVLFFVHQGEVTIVVDGENEVFSEGSFIESPKNIIHQITNNTNDIARVLVIKAPRP